MNKFRRVYDPRPSAHRELVQDRFHPQRGLDVYRVSVCHNKHCRRYGVARVRRDGTARAWKVQHMRKLAYRLGVLLGPTRGLSVRAQHVIRHPSQRTSSELARARKRNPAPKPKAPTVMFDSINLAAIPADAPAVAGYVGGAWPTFRDIPTRFPEARHLSIAVNSTQDAECLDVEPGDATPATAPGWVKRQQARGVRQPVIYCSVSQARTVLAELERHGIRRGDIRLWTAHYTHIPHRCTSACGFGMSGTADATQWTDKSRGRSLDESLCGPRFFQ